MIYIYIYMYNNLMKNNYYKTDVLKKKSNWTLCKTVTTFLTISFPNDSWGNTRFSVEFISVFKMYAKDTFFYLNLYFQK